MNPPAYPWHDFACPTCGAQPGQPCINNEGHATISHGARCARGIADRRRAGASR